MLRFLGTMLILLAASLSAQATFVTTNLATFNASVGAYYNPNPNTFTGDPGIGVYSNNGYSYTITAAPSGSGILVAPPGNSTGTGAYIYTAQDSDNLVITLTSNNVTAIGADFFAASAASAFESVAVTVTLNDGTTQTVTPNNVAGGFIGFLSPGVAITSLTVQGFASGSGLHASLDNLTVGGYSPASAPSAATPVPPTALIAIAGAPLLGLLRRYRKR